MQPRSNVAAAGSPGRASVELAGQVLDAIDEARQQPVGFARGAYLRNSRQQFLKHDPDLAAGEMGAQAEVRAGSTEAYVRVRRSRDVESLWVGEHRLVPVGRPVEQHDLVALAVVVSVQGAVRGDGATHPDDGG